MTNSRSVDSASGVETPSAGSLGGATTRFDFELLGDAVTFAGFDAQAGVADRVEERCLVEHLGVALGFALPDKVAVVVEDLAAADEAEAFGPVHLLRNVAPAALDVAARAVHPRPEVPLRPVDDDQHGAQDEGHREDAVEPGFQSHAGLELRVDHPQ